MTSRLAIYNDALLLAGERFLASLSENREPRRLLDNIWNNDGVIGCLEQGQWFFAMRTVQIDFDPDVEPPFGYNRAFNKPDDWISTTAVCSDEYFREPLTRYTDEAGYWYSDLDTIYIRYVSSDPQFGLNLAIWPRSFSEFVAAHFAAKCGFKLASSDTRFKTMIDLREHLLKVAKNKCAMALPTSFPATGNWAKSRNRGGGRRDGGNSSGSLIG